MERVLPILAIVALVLAALSAMIVSGPFVTVGLALLGLAVAVFLFLTRDMVPIIIGVVAALACVLALLGGIGGFSTEGGGVDFGITNALAGALAIAALALAAGGALATGWDSMDPQWVGYVGAGALLLAVVFAFVFMDELGTPEGAWPFVVGLLLLVALWPIVLLLRPTGATHGHAETTA